MAAASPIPERSVMVGYSILTNLLSQAIVIRFSPKPTFIAYCPYLSPALSSPVTIFLCLSSYSSIGPSISRLVAQCTLTYPMFTITLQRDSVDIGENMGIMSSGKLPAAVNNDSLTWVKARGYTTAESGMTALPDSPTLSHGRCRSMIFGRMGRYRLHRVFLLRIFLCWD